jgi:LacI family transcriptional regulator
LAEEVFIEGSINMADMPRVLLLLSYQAEYDRGILRGIVRYSRTHGPWNMYLAGVEPELPLPETEAFCGRPIRVIEVAKDHWARHRSDLRQWGADGVIGRLQNRKIVNMARHLGIPTIAMDLSDEQLDGNPQLRKLSEIRAESYAAGRFAAEHFLERSFRHFAYCGYAGRTWSERSSKGFCKRIEEAGSCCHVYQSPKRNRPILWREERDNVESWLDGLPKPIGIMGCNDVRGRQLLEVCALTRVSVPEEVAVLGVDDDQLLCELSSPPLSSIVLNTEEGGYQAAQLLDAMMKGHKITPRHIDVQPLWVVPRQSTDVLVVGDPEVAAAVRYIRANFQSSICVAKVVAQGRLSRRALELRFEQVLGRSIRTEIERTRLAWVKRVLIETALPVTRAAELAGFSNPSYLSEVFRREMGETPSEYRLRHRTVS